MQSLAVLHMMVPSVGQIEFLSKQEKYRDRRKHHYYPGTVQNT